MIFPEIKHKDWLNDALDSLTKTIDLHLRGKVPENIEGWMLVVPIRRVLRCIYGSDEEAAKGMADWNAEDKELSEAYRDVTEIQ